MNDQGLSQNEGRDKGDCPTTSRPICIDSLLFDDLILQILEDVEGDLIQMNELCLVSKKWRSLMLYKMPSSKWSFLLGSIDIEFPNFCLPFIWTNEIILDLPLPHDCKITTITTALKLGTKTNKSLYYVGVFEPAELVSGGEEGDKFKCILVKKQQLSNIILPEEMPKKDQVEDFVTQTIHLNEPLTAKKGQLVGLIYDTDLDFYEYKNEFPQWPFKMQGELRLFIDLKDGLLDPVKVKSSSWNVGCEAIFN